MVVVGEVTLEGGEGEVEEVEIITIKTELFIHYLIVSLINSPIIISTMCLYH